MSQSISESVDSNIINVQVPKILNGKALKQKDSLFGFTRNDWTLNSEGILTAESAFFVETNKATYDSIQDTSLKTIRKFTTPVGRITTQEETKYYQKVATKSADTFEWIETAQAGNGLKYALGEYSTNKFEPGAIATVSKSASETVLKSAENATKNSGITITDNTRLTRKIPDSSTDTVDKNKIPTILDSGEIDLRNLRDLSIKSKYVRTDYGDLNYPLNRSEFQDHIQFFMHEYVGGRNLPKYSFTNGNDSNTNTTLSSSHIGSVTLPVQTPISDTNTVGWGEGSMNPLQAYGMYAGLSSDNFGDAVENLLGDARKVLTSTQTNANIARGLKVFLAGEALSMRGALPRFTGAILNPNIELLFDKPQLRGFQFQFLLAARSNPEAREIKKIIRFFKQGMSVKETAGNIFLKSPNVFKVKYVYGATKETKNDHPGLHRIKTCALTSCSVDYTPAGSYMTFEDGTMTAYRITLQFSELDPITETDYRKINSESIGY